MVHLGRGTKAGHRLVIVGARTAEPLKAKVSLRQRRRPVARTRTTGFDPPRGKIPLRVWNGADAGRAKLSVKLTDAAGDAIKQRFKVRLPPPPGD